MVIVRSLHVVGARTYIKRNKKQGSKAKLDKLNFLTKLVILLCGYIKLDPNYLVIF